MAEPLLPKDRIPWRHLVAFGWLPSPLKVLAYRLFLGYRIGRGVRFSFGGVVVGDVVELGDNVEIGFLAIVQGRSIRIGRHSSVGTMSYANPFPSTWAELLEVHAKYHVSYMAPGATTALDLYPSMGQQVLLSGAPTTVSPTLGPAQSIKIAGQSASTQLSGVGLTPTISWSAPAVGTPQAYSVYVYHLTNSSGTTQWSTAAVFYTKATSVTVPPNVLTSGNTYYVAISALTSGTVDLTYSPYRSRLPYAWANALTATFTP